MNSRVVKYIWVGILTFGVLAGPARSDSIPSYYDRYYFLSAPPSTWGDGLVGFVTVGRGVSVHRADCTNITALGENPERMIEVIWDPSTAGSFTVWIQVEALDRPKLLRDVTAIIGDQGANIVASSSSSSPDRIAILRYEVELGDTEQLERLLADLRGAAGVMDAFRLITT